MTGKRTYENRLLKHLFYFIWRRPVLEHTLSYIYWYFILKIDACDRRNRRK